MESVFENNTPLEIAVALMTDGEKLARITGVSAIMLALKTAKFTPNRTGDNVTLARLSESRLVSE